MQDVPDVNNERFHPKNLIKEIQLKNQTAPRDPILDDLLKMNPRDSSTVTERKKLQRSPESINDYSNKMKQLLTKLELGYELDDYARISFESALFELTSYVPVSDDKNNPTLRQSFYPNETLSKILVDNYCDLIKLSSTYFNLSLASHITKYVVELIYSLNYWEIYHLIYLIPDLEYFLRLLAFEVNQTPFGVLVKPPTTYINDSMLSGLQYPFPYPFYNYSYHSFSKNSKHSKLSKVHIKPYIDITLKDADTSPSKRVKKKLVRQTLVDDDINEGAMSGPSTPPTNELDYRTNEPPSYAIPSSKTDVDIASSPVKKPHKESRDINISSDKIFSHKDKLTNIQNQRNGQIGQQPRTDNNNGPDNKQELLFIQLSPMAGDHASNSTQGGKSATTPGDKNTKQRSGIIHQCHLIDPNSLRPCLKIFYGKNELLRHQEFVHATKKKIYKCLYCAKNGSKIQSYPRHDSLARHIRRKHGITGKENKMAVNYAKENVEIIDDLVQMKKAPGEDGAEDQEQDRDQDNDKDFSPEDKDDSRVVEDMTQNTNSRHGEGQAPISQVSDYQMPNAAPPIRVTPMGPVSDVTQYSAPQSLPPLQESLQVTQPQQAHPLKFQPLQQLPMHHVQQPMKPISIPQQTLPSHHIPVPVPTQRPNVPQIFPPSSFNRGNIDYFNNQFNSRTAPNFQSSLGPVDGGDHPDQDHKESVSDRKRGVDILELPSIEGSQKRPRPTEKPSHGTMLPKGNELKPSNSRWMKEMSVNFNKPSDSPLRDNFQKFRINQPVQTRKHNPQRHLPENKALFSINQPIGHDQPSQVTQPLTPIGMLNQSQPVTSPTLPRQPAQIHHFLNANPLPSMPEKLPSHQLQLRALQPHIPQLQPQQALQTQQHPHRPQGQLQSSSSQFQALDPLRFYNDKKKDVKTSMGFSYLTDTSNK